MRESRLSTPGRLMFYGVAVGLGGSLLTAIPFPLLAEERSASPAANVVSAYCWVIGGLMFVVGVIAKAVVVVVRGGRSR